MRPNPSKNRIPLWRWLFLGLMAPAWALAAVPASPTPAPTPAGFQGDIFYDVFYSSYEPAIHLHYTIQGRKVRIDMVDIDENDAAQTLVTKVVESSYVELPEQGETPEPGAIWVEEKEKGVIVGEVPTPEGFQAYPTLKAENKNAVKAKEALGSAVANYETTYGYSIEKLNPAGPAGPKSKGVNPGLDADIWTLSEAQPVRNSKGREISPQTASLLRNSPFPMVLHIKAPKAAPMASATPGGKMNMSREMMNGPAHRSYWMYAVKVIPRTVLDQEFKPDFPLPTPGPKSQGMMLKSGAKPKASSRKERKHLEDLFSQSDLFSQRVTFDLTTPTPTPNR